MLSSLASLLDSFRIPNRKRRGFNIFSRRRRRQTSSLRCQGIPGVSLQETLAHEPLEQRRLLAVDVSLAGSVLTVSFDDASDDAVSVAITSEGYDSSGANVSSGTGTITQLVVQDSGTAQTSNFTLSEVGQVLSGGLSIGSVINTAVITTDSVDTGGGDVLVESGELTLDANIVSGEGSQTYDAAVVLASDVNLTTSTGVSRDMEVVFQGTVDSDDNATPRTLNVHSEAIYFYADVGSQSPLNDLVGVTVDDKAERGQFYQSVHTTGNQTYQAGSSSGDIEFNGTYTAGGDIELLGEGTFGVVLSLAGDTQIDVGTGAFSVQKGSSNTYPGGNIVSQGQSESYDLTITAGNITVPAGVGVASAGTSLSSPELKDFTINGIGTVGLNTPEVITSGNFTANPAIKIYQDTTLLSGDGEINLSSGVNNGSKALTLGDSAQTGSIFVGGLQVRHLEVGNGAFDVTLDGAMHLATNLTEPTKFLNTGSLTLKGQGSSFFGGVEALNVSQTNIAGCVATFGGDITLNNVRMLNSTYANRFDTRWTQTHGGTADGGDITISGFDTGDLSATKSVEFDIGNSTPNTVELTGNIVSKNQLVFKGIGSADVKGEANLAGGVYAQNLSFETDTMPSLNFTGNVTLTGGMTIQGKSASFSNPVVGNSNDLTLNFTESATLDSFSDIGNFTSLGAVDLGGNFNTTGFQKYEGDVTLTSNTELGATTVQFGKGVAGSNYDLTLSPTNTSVPIELDNINLSGVNELTIGGDLSLSGNLSASEIDIQGDVTLIGNAMLDATNSVTVSNGTGAFDGGHDLVVYLGGDGSISFGGDIGSVTPLNNVEIESSGTVAIGGNIAATEDIKFKASGASASGSDVIGVAFQAGKSITSLTGDITIFGQGVNSGTGVDMSNAELDAASILIDGIADGDGVFFDSNAKLIATDGIVVNGTSTHSNTSFKNYEGVRLNESSNLSAGTDLTIIGTTPAGNAVSLQANTTLTATNNLSINASFTGSQKSDRYGFAAWANVTMTADNLSIEGSTTGNSSAKSIGFDQDNILTGHSSVHLIGDRLELSYKGDTDLYVNGNGSLAIESKSASFGEAVSLEKVTVGNSFTSATIGKTTNTGDITVDSQGLDINGSIDIHGGQINLNGVINAAADDASITINGTGITVGANVSATSTGDVVLGGPATLTDSVTFTGKDMTLGGLDGGNYSVEFDFADIEIDAAAQSFTNIGNLTVTGAATINGTIQTTGNQLFQGKAELDGDTTFLSGDGSINLAGGIGGGSSGSKSLTLGDSVQTGSIFVGGLQVKHLEVGNGAFDVTLDGAMHLATNLTEPTKFLNTGSLTLKGQGSSFFGGVEALNVSQTNIAGCVATFGGDITLNNVRMLNSTYANRFDTRWTQTHGGTADGGDITISGFDTGDLSATKSVEFDIGNSTPNTVELTGNIVSKNQLVFKGIGSADVKGEANLAGGVYAQNLSFETDTMPSLNFTGNVTLTGGMTIQGKSASFSNPVVGNSNDLTLNFTESATLDSFSDIGNFTSQGAVDLGGNFNTTGFQKYEGNVTLGSDTELGATTVEFADGVTGNSHNLTLSPTSSFIELDGIQLSGVENLTIDGDLSLSGNLSAGDIDIQGDTTLIGDANLTSEIVSCVSSLQITLNGTVDGGHALSVNGATTFDGEIGGTTPLASLTTVGGTVSVGGDVTTTGNQSFGGEATIAGDTAFTGDDVSISGLDGGGFNVNFSATSTTLDANAYSVANIANLNVSGDVGLNGTIATTGNQSFGGDVGLLGDTTLTAGAGTISLGTGGEVIGLSHTLTLGDASQTGAVTLGGASAVTLGDLNVAAGNFNLAINAGASEAVTVSMPVDILSTGDLTVTTASNDIDSVVLFERGLNATAPSAVDVDGVIQTNYSAINLSHVRYTGDGSQPSFLLTGPISDPTPFVGSSITVGSLDTGIGMLVYHGGLFGSLTVQGDANIGVGLSGTGIKGWGDLNINGNTTVGSTVNVDGDQNYAENVSLTGDAGFEGKTATFTNGVLGGGNDLTLNFTQPSKLDGLANIKNFTSVGQIELNGSFETSGSQEFAGGVSLGGDATLHAASGFIKLDGIAGETYDLTIGNTTFPAPTADLSITGDVALNALNATTGNYDASLTGSSMKLQQATFDNSGNVTLGDEATDSLVIGQGLVVQNAAATTVAGNIASNGSQIKIRNINLTADTHIDTTNGGMVPAGAQILLDGNMQLGGFLLDTNSGAVDTTLEGDVTISNGSFKVLQGDLDLGESGNPSNAANITVSETATIEVPENGTLNVFDGSKLDAGDKSINIIANNISFQANAGKFISSKEITITPVTSGNNIFVGNIADTKTTSDGLRINQVAYSKMESPNIIIGGSGYTGTIAVENLSSTTSGQLSLIANGTGGAIDVTNLNLSNAGLRIDGSGATTNLSGDITTNGNTAIYDAVRLVGDTNISTSGGNVTITGGTEGIYSDSGSSHNLSINAGAGDIVVGNQTGFGNGATESLIGKVTLDSTSSITLGDGDQEMHSLDVLTSPLELGGSLGTSLILSGGLFGGADLRTGITGNKSFLEIDLESGFADTLKLGTIANVNNLAITEDSLSPSPLRKVEMHGDVTTIEGQSYEPTIELRGSVVLNATGDVSIGGTLTAGGLVTPRNVGIKATGGTVSIADFGSGTTPGNHYDVAILAADSVDLGGGVGSFGKFQHGLQFLTINTITNSVNFNATSGLSLGGNLSIESSPNVNISSGATLETEGDLTINSTDISLGANVTTDAGTLTLNGTASVTDSIVLNSGSGDLTVTGALLATTNGTHDVTINSGGTAKIGGAVGNASAASDLFFANLTTDAGGTTEFNGNIFAQEQVFEDDIVLNQGLSTNLTAGGVNATFNGNVDADSSDIVLNFNTTAIDGSKWSNLAELTVNADTGGTIGLNGTITSSGSQTYNGAVQLDGDTTLVGGFALNLAQGVSGNSKNLVLDFTSQPTSLAGNFTGINDLTSKGDVLISGEIRTSGNQSYDANVTLDGYTTLQGNSLSLNNGVNGGSNDLAIVFNTTTAINSNWTNISDFMGETSVSLTGNFSTRRQSYQNAVTLLGDTVLSASGTDYRGVAFGGNATIDGTHDLTINADSTASINLAKAIGSTAPLRSLNLASASAVEALESLTIDGTGGSGPGLRFGSTVGNINMTAAGSSISNAAQDGILFAGASTDSTLANFTITNSGGNGITMAGGDYANTTIRDTAVTTSDGHGLYANNATGFTVTNSNMTLNDGSGVYVEGLASDGVTVSNSTFGINGEALAAGNKGYGIGFAGGSNHVADNNTIGGNDLTGLLAVSPVTGDTVSNITFSNNWIGLTRNEEPVPNGQAGIWVLGDVTNSEGYTQGFVDDVTIQGNRVENAIFNGIEIDNATNVIVGGLEASKHNQINFSQQYGLSMTGDLAGTNVRGNELNGNIDTGLYLNDVKGATVGGLLGALEIYGSNFGVTAIGDLAGTQMVANNIHSNNNAGAFLMGAKNFDLFRNTIEDNGPYGVLAFEESTGTTISGNTIKESEAGVWLSGASGLTIGYDESGTPAELRLPNKITDNYSVGIIVQGSTAADNRILSNEIYLNTYYGIQFVGGAAPSVRPPRLFAASLDGDTTTVTGRLNGEIGDTYLIQYFQNKPEDMQPGRAPEGQILVHSSTVLVTSEGFVDIDADIVNGQEYTISAGDWITATATVKKDGVTDQTSVFSSGVRVREVQ